MTTTTETELYVPDPPLKLEACPEDIAAIENFVARFGWHETLWHVGLLLGKAHREATGTRKGAFRAAANHLMFIVPGCYWLDHEVVIQRPEEPTW